MIIRFTVAGAEEEEKRGELVAWLDGLCIYCCHRKPSGPRLFAFISLYGLRGPEAPTTPLFLLLRLILFVGWIDR